MTKESFKLTGYVIINDVEMPFKYSEGFLTISLYGDKTTAPIGEFNMGKSVIGYCNESEFRTVLFHSSYDIKYKLESKAIDVAHMGSSFNRRYIIDDIIIDYKSDSLYTKMVFDFDELYSLMPATEDTGLFDESRIPIDIKPRCDFEFKAQIDNVDVEFSFYYQWSIHWNEQKTTAETSRQLILYFNPTNDINFLTKLFFVVLNTFSFIFNRLNIGLETVSIYGNKKGVINSHKSIFIPSYAKVRDEKEIIMSMPSMFTQYKSHLKDLIEFISGGNVDIISLHESTKAQSHFGYKRCVAIPAAFEYYCRKFTSPILSQPRRNTISEIENYISEYINKHSGKEKDTAKQILKKASDACEPSLSEKIYKVYKGYTSDSESWGSLECIFPEINNQKAKQLSKLASEWRNEIAHEKREFQISNEAYEAMYFVEYLNYCIVLRQTGYSDEEIKNIIECLKHIQKHSYSTAR
jgi:hypothetical protein